MIMNMSVANVLSLNEYRFRSAGARYPAMPDDVTIAPPSRDTAESYQTTLATLRSYRLLAPNWDYEGGVPLAQDAESAGIVLLNAFASSDIVPDLSPLNDGGLLFEIDGPVYLALGVKPTGVVDLYVSGRGQKYEESGSAADVVAALFGHPGASSATR